MTWTRTWGLRRLRRPVARWVAENGRRPAVVVGVRYTFTAFGAMARDPWRSLSVAVNGEAARSLGIDRWGRHLPVGTHRIRVTGEVGRSGEIVVVREFAVEVKPGTVTYVAVRPPHGYLRRRTVRAAWIVAYLTPENVQSGRRWPYKYVCMLPRASEVTTHG